VTTYDEIMALAERIEEDASKLNGEPKSTFGLMRKARMDLVLSLRTAAAKYAHAEDAARA
jgi:hypothetical protein